MLEIWINLHAYHRNITFLQLNPFALMDLTDTKPFVYNILFYILYILIVILHITMYIVNLPYNDNGNLLSHNDIILSTYHWPFD